MKPWRLAGTSVIGTSHDKTGQPCQDAHAIKVFGSCDEEVLIAAVSDGAGSAELSAEGSRLACASFVQAVEVHLQAGKPPTAFDRAAAMRWASAFQDTVSGAARESERQLRDYACTFLGAVIGPTGSVFIQVGDGAIVVSSQKEPDDFAWVFWPQNGEYANMTFFLTEDRITETLQHIAEERSIDEIALFTDGIQMLALQLQARAVHIPFFRSVFAPLRKATASDRLTSGLEQFLSSAAVNTRTDDDKTLVLASRLADLANDVPIDVAAV
jgi:hypothetical protein